MSNKLRSSSALQRGVESSRLSITYVSIHSLKPSPDTTRRHSRRQMKSLVRSIEDFGFKVPALVDRDNVVRVGNARVEAAKEAGLEEIAVIYIRDLTAEQMRLFSIADNKLAEGACWDNEGLRAVFAEIAILAPELDLGSSAFTITERDIIIGNAEADRLTDFDDVPPPSTEGTIARIGERYTLGRHVVVCGSAIDPEVIKQALAGQKVRTVASDPPYNQKVGEISGLGVKKHREFAMASGEMKRPQFVEFLVQAIKATQDHLIDGALLYLFMDWRHLSELLSAAEATKLDYLNLLVWAKTNAGMGSFYRSAHEMIGVFKHGKAPHLNNVELGRNGRSRTNVLHYPGANTFAKGRNQALELHPTVKPVALMADLILDSSEPGDLILDPFGGSGSTLIAAEKTDRRACLVEIDPIYVDVILHRFKAATGIMPVLETTGETLDELAAQRVSGEA